MRSNKGLGRKAARAKRLEQEKKGSESVLVPYKQMLAWRFATKPGFRSNLSRAVATSTDARAKSAERKAKSDLSAGRQGQRASRLAVRSAHRRKVKAEKRTCLCPACHKGEV